MKIIDKLNRGERVLVSDIEKEEMEQTIIGMLWDTLELNYNLDWCMLYPVLDEERIIIDVVYADDPNVEYHFDEKEEVYFNHTSKGGE